MHTERDTIQSEFERAAKTFAERTAGRIAAVKGFVAERGAETGMAFERAGDDWVFTRRRIQIRARRAA